MYTAARVPLPKLYGIGRLLFRADEHVDIAYVIWRWRVLTQLAPSGQPYEHDTVFTEGVLAVTFGHDYLRAAEAGTLRLEDGTEFAVKLLRLSNPAVREFHIQFLDGDCSS